MRTFGDSGLLELRTDWSPPSTAPSTAASTVTWKAGSLIANPMKNLMNNDWSEAKVLFEPTAAASLEGQSGTKDFLVSVYMLTFIIQLIEYPMLLTLTSIVLKTRYRY